MFFPESLYLLSQRDQQVSWLEPLALRDTFAAGIAAANIQRLVYTVPIDRLLILQAFSFLATAGAAQTVNDVRIDIVPRLSAEIVRVWSADSRYMSTGGVAGGNWTGSILVPPQYTLRANFLFNAGAAANFFDLGVHGLLIPVGNVQRI
jgi:hypothetical protein